MSKVKVAYGSSIVIIGLYLFIAMYVYFFQESMIFFPQVLTQQHSFSFPLTFEERFVELKNQQKAHTLVFKGLDAKVDTKTAAILYFHGNAGSNVRWGEISMELANRFKMDVWVVDYPGYGKSLAPLPKSEVELLLSAEAVLASAKEVYKNQQFFVFGRSLGSGLATHLAKDPAVKGIILESPYSNLKKLALEKYPIFPSFIVRYQIDSIQNLKEINKPILIFHGQLDEVIPYHHSVKIHQSYPNTLLVSNPKGKHNNLNQFPEYWDHLDQFFNQHK